MMKRCSGAVALVSLLLACGGKQDAASSTTGVPIGGFASAGATNGTESGGRATTAGAGGVSASGGGQAGSGGHAGSGGNASGGTSGGGTGGAGQGGGGSGGTDGKITTPEMLVPVVNAFCAAARSCCKGQNEPPMLTDCESGFGAKNEPVDSLIAGAVTLDAAGLATCLAAYQAAAVSCEMDSVIQACGGIVHGTRAEGATCSLGSECGAKPGPNTCLITEQNGSVGVCKQVPHAKSGEACAFTCRKGESCSFTTYGAADSVLALCFEDEGFYCDSQLIPAKCQPIRALDAACDDDAQCGSTGYCDVSGDAKCKQRSTLGEPCGLCIPSLDCVDGKCKSPPFASTNTCEGRSLGPY